MSYITDDFDYCLPHALIAQTPLAQRRASRMMYLNRAQKVCQHTLFDQLLSFLLPGDLLVFNNTQVFPARLFGHKDSGGKLECMIERLLPYNQAWVQLRASKMPKTSSKLHFYGSTAEVLQRENDLFKLHFKIDGPMLDWLQAKGQLPLPPYIQREVCTEDLARYQTVYASKVGAVAAPTAGLHFDQEMLAALKQHNIKTINLTLHVGAGTFSPVRVQDLTQHKIHSEHIEVLPEVCTAVNDAKNRGGRVVAIGTTVLRALESATINGQLQPFSGNTNLFITPGYHFQCVDALLTNFHLPKSSLLMLVCAFCGYDFAMSCYQQAINEQYRFFSYGDCMFVA